MVYEFHRIKIERGKIDDYRKTKRIMGDIATTVKWPAWI
jgi:hypothetical protein